MNIFALDTDPTTAARMHCDQHINKMILESSQMLSTAMRVAHSKALTIYGLVAYKETHTNHPCNVWLRRSKANMLWLCKLATELNNIRLEQPNCPETHKSMFIIGPIQHWLSDYIEAHGEHTEHVQAMPIHLQGINPIRAYRTYYSHKRDLWQAEGRMMTFNMVGRDWMQLASTN